MQKIERRVVLVYWKERREDAFEIFSNLKIFCISYPAYNYNTLNNYLSKRKIPYANETVRIERKPIISTAIKKRKIVPVVKKGLMKNMGDEDDLAYWLSRPVKERLAAVTTLVSASLKKGERMNRSIVGRRKLHK